MVNHHCCVVGCSADSRKLQRLDKHPWMRGVKFIPFPVEVTRRRKWLELIRRQDFGLEQVTRHTRICSRHFEPGQPDHLRVPTLFPYNNFKEPVSRASTARQQNKRKASVLTDINASTADIVEGFPHQLDHSDEVFMDVDTATEDLYLWDIDTLDLHHETTGMATSVSSTAIQQGSVNPVHRVPADHLYAMQEEDGADRAGLRQHADAGTQTDLSAHDIEELVKTKERTENKQSLQRELFLESVLKDDKSVRYFTGMPSLTVLQGMFVIILQACAIIFSGIGDDSNPHSGKTKRGPNQKLSLWEQYILTLIRLRLGFEQRFIGVLFGVSSSTISRSFNSWINIMAKVCKPLLVWPSRDRIERHMPKQFKLYPKTRVIIDCTEVFVQKPRNPTAQAATYSTYKSHNTFKCLVGISPSGAFTFLSPFWSGNVSDRYITNHSGLLDLIEPGDHVMADRGFTIRDLLLERGAYLNIPPFTRPSTQGKGRRLSPSDILKRRRIAAVRIHVERAIERLKRFRIFRGVMDLSLQPYCDQMAIVAAIICNLNRPLF